MSESWKGQVESGLKKRVEGQLKVWMEGFEKILEDDSLSISIFDGASAKEIKVA